MRWRRPGPRRVTQARAARLDARIAEVEDNPEPRARAMRALRPGSCPARQGGA